MDWVRKLERKLGRFAIVGLMNWVVAGQIFIFAATMMIDRTFYQNFALVRSAILGGEVWRMVTFIFMPETFDILWFAFSAYFYYMLGVALESAWGAFRLNIYVLLGMLGSIAACFFIGFAPSYVLLQSLFFAYAMLYPERELRLWGVLPVKVKWMGWASGAFYLYTFVFGSWGIRIGMVLALAGFFAYFGGDAVRKVRAGVRRSIWRYKNRQQWRK